MDVWPCPFPLFGSGSHIRQLICGVIYWNDLPFLGMCLLHCRCTAEEARPLPCLHPCLLTAPAAVTGAMLPAPSPPVMSHACRAGSAQSYGFKGMTVFCWIVRITHPLETTRNKILVLSTIERTHFIPLLLDS